MAEPVKDTALVRALTAVLADVGNLFQKEIRLARAEIAEKLAVKARAGAWLSISLILGLGTLFLTIQAAVYAIAAFEFALHWACIMVAAALLAVAAGAYAKGRTDLSGEMAPNRTMSQVRRDIATVKEQLT